MRAVVESDECFVRFLMTELSPANPTGQRLQVLEADHLDTARTGMVEGTATIQGMALGEAGAPIGYWLHRVHPGVSWILPGATWQSSQRVPARDVLHIYRKRRPGQLRDVSWLAPILLRLRDLGDYEAACRRHGIDIYKVGMVWPLAGRNALVFIRGKREILVIEEAVAELKIPPCHHNI
jgi:capsid protein